MLKLFRPKLTKETQIKAVLFDFGGVMVKDEYYPFFSKFENITGMSKEELYLDLVKGEELKAYERGDISSEEFWKKISKKYKIDKKVLFLIRKFWPTVLIPIQGTIDIVRSLKGKYVVGAISNIGKEMSDYLQRTYKLQDLFDFTILSYKVGVRKPDAKIYKIALKKAKAKPEETFFTDNFFENIEGASKLGIHAVHFETPGQIKRELARLGVKV